MRSLLRKLFAVWSLRRMRRLLGNALALHRRGEVRSDGLSLLDASIKLTVSWRARDVHPWDRDLPEERAAPRLLDQTLHDAEDAVERIFAAFPEADTLELSVLESDPASNRVLMSGLVVRSDLGCCASSSVAMRLRMLGINYHLANQHLEAIATRTLPSSPTRSSSSDDMVGWPVTRVRRPADLAAKSGPQWPDGERGPH
jgi:hypothetical protein